MCENQADQEKEMLVDRRSQRSQLALINALIELMAVKSYDAISIKEIVEKANVGRSTFYSHFQTKDDLVKCGFERVLDEVLNMMDLSKDESGLSVDTTMLFQHTKGHYHLYKNLMWGEGYRILTSDELNVLSDKLENRFLNFFPDAKNLSVPLNVLCHFIAGNLMILLKWWLDNKMPYSPEKMNELFQALVMPGVKSTFEIK